MRARTERALALLLLIAGLSPTLVTRGDEPVEGRAGAAPSTVVAEPEGADAEGRASAAPSTVAEGRASAAPSTVAEGPPADDESPPDRPYVEEVRARFSYYRQRGRGLQSQADATPEGGSQRLDVASPAIMVRLRQNPDVVHTFTVPLDALTSASADALDAVSSASLGTEAGDLEIQTDWAAGREDHLSFRGSAHLEETLRSTSVGVGYMRDLAEDNATVSLVGNASIDYFDLLATDGWDYGYTHRAALNLNASVSQILSRTTVAVLTYGVTHQWGVLQHTWNAVPVDCDSEGPCPLVPAEIFPGQRTRHAVAGFLAQRIVPSDSTLRLRYRFYSDDIGLAGHTLESEFYQYITRRAYVVARYRFHRQQAADFWMPRIPENQIEMGSPRTADSDLAAFDAHEWGFRALVYLDDPRFGHDHSLDLGYLRYRRTNDLVVDMLTIGYSRTY